MTETMQHFFFFFYFFLNLFIYFFYLWWILPYIEMKQPWVKLSLPFLHEHKLWHPCQFAPSYMRQVISITGRV